jgi:hypothetical protein
VPFILNGLNIDISSIVVKVRDPNDPNILSQPLDPSMYVTTVIGPNVQVTVLTVPPDFLSALPNFEYTFEVSYSLSSNVQIRTEEFAYRLSLYLFDNLLNPYFNYSRVTQETTSGTIPGGPENSTSYTAGIIVQKAPFTVLGEYQDVESRILPYQQWRAIVSYRKNLTPTLDVFAQAFVTRTDYGQGQTVPLSTPYTETIVGGDFRLQKSFPLKNIYANGGGSITHSTRQNTDTLFYSLTAFLTWKVGQFDLNLGGNVSHSTATLPTGEQKYSTQYYFLNMKRKLF